MASFGGRLCMGHGTTLTYLVEHREMEGRGLRKGTLSAFLEKSTEMGGSIDFAELTAVEKEQSQKGLFLAEYTL